MPSSRTRRSQVQNYWPGFVDALTSLLLVFVFLLSLFMLAQSFLGQEIKGKDSVLTKLNSQISELSNLLQLERSKSSDLETNISSLTATLASTKSERDTIASQLAGIGAGSTDKDAQIAGLNSQLASEKELSDQAKSQLSLLNQQLAALRTQIGALEEALQASETRDTQSRTSIADLGRRLNLALAQRVQDLSRYRSDFFGKLRQILEGRADVRVVGDRFVFQSEVLFAAGQADVSTDGKTELAQLATALIQLEKEIPPDINWVLRIDGHTDKRPISNAQFPSNWELSAARAIAVAKYLTTQGIDPKRLVPAGFGEFSPIDPGDTEDAYRKNRRIEFKLTEG
ncbi:MAG TPA: peptidoglycan -binding protein [Arsenicitalea sp.]|jgi:chemotaxis protein MotB|nr:peptidoglycan -binding protein [Arsenicitalea sp.]